MDIEKILAKASSMGVENIEKTQGNVAKEILLVAEKVEQSIEGYHPWFLGVDMIKYLGDKFNKANVRNHLERLVEQDKLQSRLRGTNKVYRLKVEEDDSD